MLTLTGKTEEFELLQKTKSEDNGGKAAVKDLGAFLLEGGRTESDDEEEDDDDEVDEVAYQYHFISIQLHFL